MDVPVTGHGDYHYELVHTSGAGTERRHPFATDEPLEPGSVVRFEGRYWLIERIEETRAIAKPGRYRLELRHPDGRVEAGAFRRVRADAPTIGHTFTTIEDQQPVSWEVRERRLARDEQGEPYLELIAERDYSELEEDVSDHELEHTLARREEQELPGRAEAAFARAEQEGLSAELVALDPGEEPDWTEAANFIDALILEEVEDDLIEHCGVDPNNDPEESWLPKIKERLNEDLEQFRSDVDGAGEHRHIEEWRFRGGRIFASFGTHDDESDPDSGHGWLCRLLDGGALGAAGFVRVRKVELDLFEE
jgi:hypothetical protein